MGDWYDNDEFGEYRHGGINQQIRHHCRQVGERAAEYVDEYGSLDADPEQAGRMAELNCLGAGNVSAPPYPYYNAPPSVYGNPGVPLPPEEAYPYEESEPGDLCPPEAPCLNLPPGFDRGR